MKRAPPSARLATSIRPPCRSRSRRRWPARAWSRHRTRPGPGRSVRRRGEVLRLDPGPSSSTISAAPRPFAWTATPTRPSTGPCRTASSTRIITSRRSARRIASADRCCGSTWIRTPDRSRLAHRRGAVRGDVTEVDRDPIERDRTGIRTSQQEQVLDDRGHVGDLVSTSLSAVSTAATGSARCRSRRSTLLRITVSGVRNSWLGVGPGIHAAAAARSDGWRATRGSGRGRGGHRARRTRKRRGPRRARRRAPPRASC